MVKTKLIGISGCTNGGKTTLSKRLLLEFPNSYYMSQDEFYHERNSEHYTYIPELDSFNFDVITAIDMKRFHRELSKLVRSGQYEYIFMDGILLFEDEKLCNMLDRKYFIDLDKDECYRRRKSRNYIIADTSNYFESCAWTEFLKYKEKCQVNCADIVYIDGTESPEDIFIFVANDIVF